MSFSPKEYKLMMTALKEAKLRSKNDELERQVQHLTEVKVLLERIAAAIDNIYET